MNVDTEHVRRPALRAPPKARRSTRAVKAITRLEGEWDVRRVSGLLPPFVTKRIGPQTGWTFWFGLPVGKFVRERLTLRYLLWPVRDELRRAGDGFLGRGLIFGREFCQFRLERR